MKEFTKRTSQQNIQVDCKANQEYCKFSITSACWKIYTRAVKEYSRVRVLASQRETRDSESRSKDSIRPTGTRVPASPYEGVPGSWKVGLLPALIYTVEQGILDNKKD